MARNRVPLAVRGTIERGVDITGRAEAVKNVPKRSMEPTDLAPPSDWLDKTINALDETRWRSDQDSILRSLGD